jgi:hypothetical protein
VEKLKELSKKMDRKKILNFKDYLYIRETEKIEESFSGLITEDENSEKSNKARIKVNKALIWININRGFFARLLANLNIYGSTELDPPTMATNGLNIVYHPDFVLSQSDAAIRFVLCHEILHCVGDHMSRRGNRDPLIWNYAADYAINPILNAEVSGTVFNWPLDEKGERIGLYEEKYEGMTAEVIYDLLVENMKETKKISEKSNFGDVQDSDEDLPQPDSESDIVQRVDYDEDEEEGGRPLKPKEKSEDPGEQKSKQEGGDAGSDAEESGESSQSLIGRKIRITEGPDKGKIGTIKQVLPNGDVIIE